MTEAEIIAFVQPLAWPIAIVIIAVIIFGRRNTQ